MKTIKLKFKGIDTLLINNPQTSDPLNKYAKELKSISSKRKKTDDDVLAMRQIELRSKIYWDDQIGIYIPSTWITASIAGHAYATAKIAKAKIRGAVFPTEPKIPLHYHGQHQVKQPIDIVNNDAFHKIMSLKQGQVRVVKAAPIFKNWSFETTIDYDESVLNERELLEIVTQGATYGGFGDFRPTHGRATVEVID